MHYVLYWVGFFFLLARMLVDLPFAVDRYVVLVELVLAVIALNTVETAAQADDLRLEKADLWTELDLARRRNDRFRSAIRDYVRLAWTPDPPPTRVEGRETGTTIPACSSDTEIGDR